MKDGQIAEYGTHTQLMGKERDYATLFNSMQQEVRPGSRGTRPALLNKASLPPLHNNIEHYMLNNS